MERLERLECRASGFEDVEPLNEAQSDNILNGAQRLNGLNVLNGSIF
jgi:hypothetical protein